MLATRVVLPEPGQAWIEFRRVKKEMTTLIVVVWALAVIIFSGAFRDEWMSDSIEERPCSNFYGSCLVQLMFVFCISISTVFITVALSGKPSPFFENYNMFTNEGYLSGEPSQAELLLMGFFLLASASLLAMSRAKSKGVRFDISPSGIGNPITFVVTLVVFIASVLGIIGFFLDYSSFDRFVPFILPAIVAVLIPAIVLVLIVVTKWVVG